MDSYNFIEVETTNPFMAKDPNQSSRKWMDEHPNSFTILFILGIFMEAPGGLIHSLMPMAPGV